MAILYDEIPDEYLMTFSQMSIQQIQGNIDRVYANIDNANRVDSEFSESDHRTLLENYIRYATAYIEEQLKRQNTKRSDLDTFTNGRDNDHR